MPSSKSRKTKADKAKSKSRSKAKAQSRREEKGKGKATATSSGTATPQAGQSTPRAAPAAPSEDPKVLRKDAAAQVSTVDYVNKGTDMTIPYVYPTTEGYAGNKNAFYQQGVREGYRSVGTQTADTYVDPDRKPSSTFHTEEYISKGGDKRWENEDRVYEWPVKKYQPDGTPKY